MKQRAICILGMHRSGTSTLSRAVNLLGAYLGEDADIMGALEDNPKGFWERSDINALLNRLLLFLGSRWDASIALPEDWHKLEDVKPYRDELYAIVNKAFSGYDLWAWKDPRTNLLMPVFNDVLNQLNTEVLCVFAVRNPLDVARSLNKRNNYPLDKGYGIWLNYSYAALSDISDIPTVFVSYDSLLEDWRKELRRISGAFDIPWPADEEALKREMSTFIDPGLRHSASDIGALKLADAPAPVTELYEYLIELAGSDSAVRVDTGRFRSRHDEFNLFSRFFRYDALEAMSLGDKNAALALEIYGKNQEIHNRDIEIHKRDAELNKIYAALSERDEALNRCSTELHRIHSSRGYRMLMRLRSVRDALLLRNK